MSTCLGLYVDNNIIKYAKISIDHNQTKVENFGVKFFDDYSKAVSQIVEETFSYKTPICVNLVGETYDYFQVFSLLNKKDLPKAIKTEFETLCSKKGYNPSVFETRYAVTPDTTNEDRLRVINVRENKVELNKTVQRLSGYKLGMVTPTPMVITNVKQLDKTEKSLIVNIEQKTMITTVIDGNIYDIQMLDTGCEDFLDKINLKENSYQRAYEVCKETTIYTAEGKELKEEEAEYLEEIMPVLYDIVGQVRKILNSSQEKIDKVYITGTGALINNVDLYFEEYLEDVNCEILKPDIVKVSPEVNIKDYVEVNSAIALALAELGKGIKDMNFKEKTFTEKLFSDLGSGKNTISIKGNGETGKASNWKEDWLVNDLSEPLDDQERRMLRGTIAILIFLIVYCVLSFMIKRQIDNKSDEADASIKDTKQQIALADSDTKAIQTKTNEYKTKIENLEKLTNDSLSDLQYKKSIPNLLNRLINITPQEVQITSINNTTDKHIVIGAQSSSYEQLGYFTSSIRTSATLLNVISSPGKQENNIISITIEGDLP